MSLAFFMKHMRFDLKTGLAHLRACRPIAEPNTGFMAQLKAYESKEFGKMSDVPLFKHQQAAAEEEKKEDLSEEQMQA